ncbi:MAG: aminotransferase class V-fold PLP-dependent enzyme [Promethearchaeota archaeon]
MDPYEFRNSIPLLRNNPDIVYLDSATTTLIPDTVIQRMKEFYEEIGVIPNRGAYDLVLQSNKTLNKVRNSVSNFFNVDFNRIAFTTSTSHGSATAIAVTNLTKKDRVLFASNLHNSSFLNWFRFVQKNSINFDFIKLNKDGQVLIDDLEDKISLKIPGRTIVVLDHAPMGFGTLLNLNVASEVIHNTKDSYLFLDATRTAGLVDLDISRENIDYLVCQSHVGFFAPPGTGILIVPEEVNGEPCYIGSGSVIDTSKEYYHLSPYPNSVEIDSVNIGGLVGLEAGIKLLNEIGINEIRNHCMKLIEIFCKNVEMSDDILLFGSSDPLSRSNLLSIKFKNISCHDLAFYVHELGKICVRSGSLCSHLLIREINSNINNGFTQFSFNYYNTELDLKKAIEILNSINMKKKEL